MTHRKLASLSDNRLLARTQKLANVERRVTISILLHLNEVERRRLHLKRGYGSLFDYCVEHLGFSAPAAGRRIQSARCVRKYRVIHGMLERNEINLTTLSMVAGILTKENGHELLSRIGNKSKREVEAIKAEYTGPVLIHDRMRSVCVTVPERIPVPDLKDNSTLAGESGNIVDNRFLSRLKTISTQEVMVSASTSASMGAGATPRSVSRSITSFRWLVVAQTCLLTCVFYARRTTGWRRSVY